MLSFSNDDFEVDQMTNLQKSWFIINKLVVVMTKNRLLNDEYPTKVIEKN